MLRFPGVTVTTRQALQRLARPARRSRPSTPADLRSPTVFTRLNRHCRGAEHLARMILGNSSLLNTAGTSGAAVFLVDMNKAFEDFVASRLTRYLHGQLLVRTQKPDQLDTGGHTRIIPTSPSSTTPGCPPTSPTPNTRSPAADSAAKPTTTRSSPTPPH